MAQFRRASSAGDSRRLDADLSKFPDCPCAEGQNQLTAELAVAKRTGTKTKKEIL